MKEVLKNILRKPFQVLGYDIRRIKTGPNHDSHLGENQVVPNVWRRPAYLDLVPSRLNTSQAVALLGSVEETSLLRPALGDRGLKVTEFEWDWDSEVPVVPSESAVVLCRLPMNESQWRTVRGLKKEFGARLIGLQELVFPL